MTALADLDSALTKVVRGLWPQFVRQAQFQPLIDLSLGDVGCAVGIDLAAQTGLHPDAICKEIIGAWNLPPGLEVSILRGYLNVRFEHPNDIFTIEPESLETAGLGIVLPAYSNFQPPLSYLRIALVACTQYALARAFNCPVRFKLGGRMLTGSLPEVVRQVLTSMQKEQPADSLTEIVKSDFAGSRELVTVWLPPQTLARSEFSLLCQSLGADSERLRVNSPTGPWLEFRTHRELPQDFAAWKDAELRNLCWYLSESLPGSEIDFFVPRSSEDANLFWYWQAVSERGEKLLPGPPKQNLEPLGDIEALAPRLRTIAIRRRFLRLFLIRAAHFGEVTRCSDALRDLLSQVSRVLNSPDFRIALSKDGPHGPEQQILAGAVQSLSDSITLCDFEED